MKKVKLTLIALLLGIVSLNANPIDASVAQKAAGNFYTSIYPATISNISLVFTERDQAGAPVYYVFDVTATNQKGFIIISAEDATHPIIGYSNEGYFVIPAANNNVSFWLQERKNEISAIRAQKVSATPRIASEWRDYTASANQAAKHNAASQTFKIVGPLCKSLWNQSPFYNAYCPGGSVTGCVATAMAQIMCYWKYPGIGISSHCYNDAQPFYSENYGQQCAEFDTSHYIWSAMQLSPLGDSNSQIAKLMYDCGVSVDMDYSPTGSGAQVMGSNGPSAYNSYTQYFGYDADSINSAYYDPNQQASWIALLEGELDKGRPMQFQGFDVNEGGHSWVCDGYYNGTNTMHMNWGWGGYNDGWYAVDAMNPSPFNFTYNIAVIYGIQPPPSALGVNAVADNSTAVTVYPNPSNGVFNFSLPNNATYQVKVYNVLGQQVNNGVLSSVNNHINLAAQAKGVYIYKLFTEQGSPVSAGRLVVE